MGELFNELCKGPVIAIDDMIDTGDPIDQLIREIEGNNLPVISFKTLSEARAKTQGFLSANFIILDWKMIGEAELVPVEVLTPAGMEEMAGEEVIDFIKELRKICIAPIFILSAYDKGEIISKLNGAGITEEKHCVFVENKSSIIGTLIQRIEDWIRSPHIYLMKCWTNEWLEKNSMIFWELNELNPDWPALFYRSFESRGEDPILGLRDTLFQLISSEIEVSMIDTSYLVKEEGKTELESLKDLYRRIVYTTKNIERDIRPGDIFKTKEGAKERYYLNIRPECDTTKPQKEEGNEVLLYLLEGQAKRPKDYKDRYDPTRGQIIPWQNEIFLLHLDNHHLVRFEKKELIIKAYSEITGKDYKKICRVVPPFVTQIRQSYSNYVSRFGIPSYPREIVDLVFPQE